MGAMNALLILLAVILAEALLDYGLGLLTPSALRSVSSALSLIVTAPIIEEGGRWAIGLGRPDRVGRERGLVLYTGAMLLFGFWNTLSTLNASPKQIPGAWPLALLVIVVTPSIVMNMINSLIVLRFSDVAVSRRARLAAIGGTLLSHMALNAFGRGAVRTLLGHMHIFP
jgi:hypothetical protein